jgi:hypothetical protein
MVYIVESRLVMAALETDLPSEDGLGRASEKTSTFSNPEVKIRYNDDAIANSFTTSPHGNALDDSCPIIYHYLTFETPLPLPSRSSDPSAPPAPPQPDLKKYISPFEWPESRKSFTIWLSCIATLITAYTAGSYSPPSKQMSDEWHVSEVAVDVGITSFCAGFAMCVPPSFSQTKRLLISQ